jgi:tRNA A37 methylthiotransferase MiaB
VRFEQAVMFAYSERERTHAFHRMRDDVPEAVKQRRLREVIEAFHRGARTRAEAEVGRLRLVLVEGESRRSREEGGQPQLTGRTDSNKRCVFDAVPVADGLERAAFGLENRQTASGQALRTDGGVPLRRGDYAVVRVDEANMRTLFATPLARTTLADWAAHEAAAARSAGDVAAWG